ncbi:MAG: DUF599 family protein [Promethearchaeota archaeon]|jgi:uncharacterized membrane protein
MLDELAFINFIFCILTYICVILFSYKRKKHTKLKFLSEIYRNWVKKHTKDENQLVAIQTLRNFIMGNSTFISAFFILLGLLVGFYSSGFFNNEPFWGNTNFTLGLMQISLNIIITMFCLINFSLSIRSITRLSLIITGNPEEYSKGAFNGLELANKTFMTAKNHWMAGVRGLFYLIATLLWFINSWFFIIGTILITLYLIAIHDVKLF